MTDHSRIGEAPEQSGADVVMPTNEVSGGRRRRRASMWHLIPQAVLDALRKLSPRKMVHSPVMFVVQVGSVISSYYAIAEAVRGGPDVAFLAAIAAWLWFTVIFANFAEAMAEGRGKAQADTLRKKDRRGGRRAAPRVHGSARYDSG